MMNLKSNFISKATIKDLKYNTKKRVPFRELSFLSMANKFISWHLKMVEASSLFLNNPGVLKQLKQ